MVEARCNRGLVPEVSRQNDQANPGIFGSPLLHNSDAAVSRSVSNHDQFPSLRHALDLLKAGSQHGKDLLFIKEGDDD